jgi:hypothetical protein
MKSIEFVESFCKDGVSINRINGTYHAFSGNRKIHEDWNLTDMTHWLYVNGYTK